MGFGPMYKGFADLCLTTWRPRRLDFVDEFTLTQLSALSSQANDFFSSSVSLASRCPTGAEVTDRQRLEEEIEMVVGLGFEPRKAWLADLQSAPFGHFGILPSYWIVREMVVGLGFEPRKAWLADLQSAPFGHFGILPSCPRCLFGGDNTNLPRLSGIASRDRDFLSLRPRARCVSHPRRMSLATVTPLSMAPTMPRYPWSAPTRRRLRRGVRPSHHLWGMP